MTRSETRRINIQNIYNTKPHDCFVFPFHITLDVNHKLSESYQYSTSLKNESDLADAGGIRVLNGIFMDQANRKHVFISAPFLPLNAN